MEWLFAPMDATRLHDVGWHLSWHARLMTLAWGVLVPLGILSARYFKILPSQNWPQHLDNIAWWNMHRFCQYSATLLMPIGLLFILTAPPLTIAPGPHWFLGWTVLCLAALQILGAYLRGTKGGPSDLAKVGTLRGDHFDMTPRRLVFEYCHKILGYGALLLSVITILSGLWQANAPNWMWLTLMIWWVGLLCLAVLLQKKGMAVDTYQAIWGADPSLPGNARKPIGWGIRRLDHSVDQQTRD